MSVTRRIARSVRHPILSTITKELFNFRSRAQGYLALFPELQVRMAFSLRTRCTRRTTVEYQVLWRTR